MFDSMPGGRYRYAELHAHSAYSFLDGANEPEALAQAAAELGLEALALTDHDGLPGVVRLAQAARASGLRTVYGSELTLEDGSHLPVLARGVVGYHRLASAVSEHNLRAGQRRDPAHHLPDLAACLSGSCLVLTGTARGPVRRALGDPLRPAGWDLDAASRCLAQMVEVLGRQCLAVEITLDGAPTDAALTRALTQLARQHHLPLVATGAVRCARPADSRLADVLTATRLGKDLDTVRGYLPATGRWLRDGADMARLHRRSPGAVNTAAEIAEDLAFDLALVAPDLPSAPVPEGHTPDSWLAHLTAQGARERYGERHQDPRAWQVIDHELEVITSLGFAGYFLIVREIVDFCRASGILCQGRGSAANSAVCYALGITAVDAVRHRMLFERFLSPGRAGYPDIDLDIEACRREEVIQHVYARYGRRHAAQVATVISYRPRSAVRDAARALGYPTGLQDAWARSVERDRSRRGGTSWANEPAPQHQVQGPDDQVHAQPHGQPHRQAQARAQEPGRADSGRSPGRTPPGPADHQPPGPADHQPPGSPRTRRANETSPPAQVRQVADRLLLLPRHLGIHSGGMVLSATPVAQVCPVRWAAMPGRTVLQWDKDDCAAAGLVKFDLLGLGALTALRLAFTSLAARGETVPNLDPDQGTLRAAQVGRPWDLHTLPEEDPAVYRLLTAADTVGVFQVESRAQMATLPRLRPRTFYDIVVEVALIRPGPIQGDAVNPYLRRRLGREKVTYLHPLLRPALEKTLGVPLFQEQLMQIAVDAAGFSPAEADALRQAMSAKRSVARMEALHARLVQGMRERGIDAPTAEQVFDKLRAFADFGFPESHAFSFAYLVYASAWLKIRRPEDFYAGVLAAQPMGFWSPATLVADARRHGVRVEQPDVNHSAARAQVEQVEQEAHAEQTEQTELAELAAAPAHDPGPGPSSRGRQVPPQPSPTRLTSLDVHPHLAVRLGLEQLRGIGAREANRIVSEREAHGPYRSIEDLAVRVRLSRRQLETLAASGALGGLAPGRREALWTAGALAQEYGTAPKGRSPARSGATSTASDGPGTGASPGRASQYTWFQPPLPGTAVGARAPRLRQMSRAETIQTDLALSGVSVQGHPVSLLRAGLSSRGVVPVAQLGSVEDGTRVRVAGVVTHRQRPHTAHGTIFLNLEDETGLLNVICSPGMWRRYRSIGRRAGALVARGRLERADGVTALLAEHLEVLPGVKTTGSRDWT